jgi:hypothetical protein
MSKINSLLSERCNPKERSGKMSSLAQKSTEGKLSSFSGIFGFAELSDGEKSNLKDLLERFSKEEQDILRDYQSLIHITSEIKAINNQAALLHGERIKQAQIILKSYQDGAFTAWLLNTYGNRQTPYNLLQYFEFYNAIPLNLRKVVESMPRQAIYTLSSREGSIDEKINIVKRFNGQSKRELLELIRELFPLSEHDKRRQNWGDTTTSTLEALLVNLRKFRPKFSSEQKKSLKQLLEKLQTLV